MGGWKRISESTLELKIKLAPAYILLKQRVQEVKAQLQVQAAQAIKTLQESTSPEEESQKQKPSLRFIDYYLVG